MIEIRPIIKEETGKGKAFLLTGAFNPYTIGHEEMARSAATHAHETGHTHIYHGIGASEKSEDAPLSMAHKRKVIRASHKHLSKDVKGIRFGILPKEHSSPFHQVLHLAKQGHSHITVGLGSDQMGKKGLRSALETHVKQHGGMLDQDGKTVHPVKLGFHEMGAKRDERPLKRTQLLKRLKSGDLSVAKAGHLRKAVREGDTELAHALMPKSAHRKSYFSAIAKAQAGIAKKTKRKLKEGILSFMDFVAEAPEVDPYIEPGEPEYAPKYDKIYINRKKHVLDKRHERYVGHRNLGEIHPGYELHRHVVTDSGYGSKHPLVHSHRYTIVHKKTKDVAGEIDAHAGKIDRKTGEHTPGTGKGLQIAWVGINSDHSSSKVGKSLAVAAYKHLHNKGHSIKSDKRQSYGGAHVWDQLRKDPDVKHHLKFHDELDNKASPAHELSYNDIWQEHRRGQESTLVLHAKPKKKAVTEDIELIPVDKSVYAETKPRKAEVVHKDYGTKTYSSDKVVTRKNHGEIHPGYELHQHSVEMDNTRPSGPRRILKHKFTIVHKASGDIAGEMHAWGGKLHPKKGVVFGSKGKGLKVTYLQVHPYHSSKKVGTSLAVEMYRHLHRRGHAIQSDSVQSHGGAHVWNTMRNDRELKKHMMIHDDDKTDTKQKHAFQTRAHKRPERHIWHQFSRSWSGGRDNPSKVEPEYGVDPDFKRTLILAGKKRKKAVTEDIHYVHPEERGGKRDKKHSLAPMPVYDDEYRAVLDKASFGSNTSHENLGEFHPGYELHRHKFTNHDGTTSHDFHMVHKASGRAVGRIETEAGKYNRNQHYHDNSKPGNDLSVQYLHVHPSHGRKIVGASLAKEAYRHLHRLGHRIVSGSSQTPGGKRVWDDMRYDPELGKHITYKGKNAEPLRVFGKRQRGLHSTQIWTNLPSDHPGDYGEEVPLVLNPKPKKRKKAVTEDIEVSNILSKPSDGYKPRDFARTVKNLLDTVKDKKYYPRRSGRIAKGYTLYTSKDPHEPEHGHVHHIVHDDTNHVAGEIWTRSYDGDHEVTHTNVHGDHTQKKIGKSLAVLAYKHLAKKRGSLRSSNLQSPGGASIWNRLRKDPEMKGQIFHKMRGKPEVPAHDIPDKKIWAAEVKIKEKPKSAPEHLPWSKKHRVSGEHANVMGSRLVIRPVQKKAVTEDIEVANVMGKPYQASNYIQDWGKMVANRPWMKPKRSGRIAKDYTMHTVEDPESGATKIHKKHYIVHDPTNHVAGTIETLSHGDDHTVVSTEMHGNHTKAKIGKSIAVMGYKHLARKLKGNLWSSNLQSPGGASVWNRLRKDSRMKGRVFHSMDSESKDVPAHDLPDKLIWASETKVKGSKGTPKPLSASKHHPETHERVMRSRLVIRPKQKT